MQKSAPNATAQAATAAAIRRGGNSGNSGGNSGGGSTNPSTAGNASKHRGLTLALLIIAAVIAFKLAADLLPANPLPAITQDTGTLAVGVFVESFPFVVLGTLVSTAVQLWVPQRLLFRLLPKSAVLRRAVLSLLGVLLPVCECGNVPLARGLLRRGLSPAEALTFVFAAPLLNPVTIITTYQAFGFDHGILLARIIGGFVIANLIGAVFATANSPERLLQPDFAASCNHAHTHEEVAGGKLGRFGGTFAAEITLLMPALAIGSLLAGVFQILLTQDSLLPLGSHPLWSVLVLIALAAIVSVCSTVDAFFILGFASVFMPGAITAFLIFGALIDVKLLILLRTTFRAKTLALATLIALLSTAAIGFGVNLLNA